MVGKDNWRGFLDAIYSKWRLFLPILSPFFHSHSFSRHPSPSAPHLLARSYLSSLPFFLCFHLIFKREIWINFFCVAEGTTSCELQILANTAIYLKWQIKQSNLLEMRRFFELSSFEKVCVFLLHGEHLQKKNKKQNLLETSTTFCPLMKKYNSEKQGLWFASLFTWIRCQECFRNLQALKKMHEVQSWIHLPTLLPCVRSWLLH